MEVDTGRDRQTDTQTDFINSIRRSVCPCRRVDKYATGWLHHYIAL